MGYNTDFEGQFDIDKPVSKEIADKLEDLWENIPADAPERRPGRRTYCQWVLEGDQHLAWDGNENFYCYVEWLKYIIDKVLRPAGYTVSGTVRWRGEDYSDMGLITVHDNKVSTSTGRIVYDG